MDEKQPGWLTRNFDRYVDRDRAARHYGKAFIASNALWGVKAGVVLWGLTDLYATYNANSDPTLGIVDNVLKNKNLIHKFLMYEGAWLALHTARWGLLGYFGVGVMHARKLKKQKALGASPPNP